IYSETYTHILFIYLIRTTQHTELYTLSLHDALPIFQRLSDRVGARSARARMTVARPVQTVLDRDLPRREVPDDRRDEVRADLVGDRKSTRLNSSHVKISYAVFCLKKKKKHK